MKKLLLLSIVILFNLSLNANAAEPEAAESKIAVVDIQKVLEKSTAAVDIRDRIKKQRDKYQSEISKEEEKLRADEQKLATESSVLAKQAFEKKREEFKAKLIKVQKDVQDKRANLDSSLSSSLEQVQKVVFEIIAELASEKGFEVAVPASQILYWKPEVDITNEVLKRLDKKLPKVKADK